MNGYSVPLSLTLAYIRWRCNAQLHLSPQKTVHVNTLTTHSTSDHTPQTLRIKSLSFDQCTQSARSRRKVTEFLAAADRSANKNSLSRTRGRLMSLTVIREAAGDLKSYERKHTQPVVHVSNVQELLENPLHSSSSSSSSTARAPPPLRNTSSSSCIPLII